MSFLPPAPPAAATAQDSDAEPDHHPPAVSVLASVRPISTALPLQFPPRPTLVDPYLRRADTYFQAGRRLLQDGDLAGARKEFDRAIDTLLDAPSDVEGAVAFERKFERLVEEIHRLDVARLGSGETEQQFVYDKSPIDTILDLTLPIDPKWKGKVKDEVTATPSQLPLEENDAVLSYINFFSSERGRRILLAGLKRAGRYKPMISRILREEGVPEELIYLAQAESGFLPRALSRKAAVGMWQFIQSRGREYGLTQTSYSDDRLDPERATRAAARHLRDLYEDTGDWYLALAAYNCGPGGVSRAVSRTGYADFWELRNRKALPKETANYVPAILAMTIMMKNAGEYGLEDVITDDPIEYDSIQLEALTNVPLIADAAGRTPGEIRQLNPSLLRNHAPAGYEVRVPKGSADSILAGLTLVPPQNRAEWRLHRVDGGENLAAIGRRYSVAPATISAVNKIAYEPEDGALLAIPAAVKDVKTAVLKTAKSAKRTPTSARNARASKNARASSKTPSAQQRGVASTTLRARR